MRCMPSITRPSDDRVAQISCGDQARVFHDGATCRGIAIGEPVGFIHLSDGAQWNLDAGEVATKINEMIDIPG